MCPSTQLPPNQAIQGANGFPVAADKHSEYVGGLRQVRGGVGQQAGEEFHAAQWISNFVRQYRFALRKGESSPRRFALTRQTLLFCNVSHDPDGFTPTLGFFAKVCAQDADSV